MWFHYVIVAYSTRQLCQKWESSTYFVFGYHEYHFKLSCMFSQKTAILIHFYQAYVRLYPFYFLPLCVVFLAADDTEYVTIF